MKNLILKIIATNSDAWIESAEYGNLINQAERIVGFKATDIRFYNEILSQFQDEFFSALDELAPDLTVVTVYQQSHGVGCILQSANSLNEIGIDALKLASERTLPFAIDCVRCEALRPTQND